MKIHHTFKAVIFDMGQTIVHPDYPFLLQLATDFGVETTLDEVAKGMALAREKFMRGDREDNWKEFFTFWLSYVGANPSDFPPMLKRIHERHQREHLWNWVEPTASQAFTELKSDGLRLAVVSNADGTVAAMLRKFKLDSFFECVVDSHIVGVEKPAPEIFMIALRQLELLPEHCVYVGDNYDKDVVGARNAGLQPVLIDPYQVVPEKDVEKITTLAELPPLLRRWRD